MPDETFTDAAYPDGCRCAACQKPFTAGDLIRFYDVERSGMTFSVPRCIDCATQDMPLHDDHPLLTSSRLVFRADGYVEVFPQ